MTGIGFLETPTPSAGAQELFDADLRDYGYVMNASRLWAYQPETHDALFDVMRQALSEHRLTIRERGVLVAACASTLTDSYCSLAWGSRLAAESDADLAAGVLRGDDDGLTAAEKAMATWARLVARDPNGTTAADVQALRDGGFDDAHIFSITTFVALRIAFSTVNDALGAQPDPEFRNAAPAAVLDAVTYGRPIEATAG
jgi:alkylhydroperoxidase family enzyme